MSLHIPRIDGSLLPWMLKLRESLLIKSPLPNGVHPIPDSVLLEPKWALDLKDSEESDPKNDIESIKREERAVSSNGTLDDPAQADIPQDGKLAVRGNISAKVISNERATPSEHWQDVRHIKFNVESTPYLPGDALAIYPKNFPSDVNELLSIMDWESVADKPLRLVPTGSGSHVDSYSPQPWTVTDPLKPLTLRGLLTSHLDIMSIPRRSFFSAIAHYTSDDTQKERLVEFTDPQYIDELYDYTTRPRRSILEVLQEFETVRIPWQHVLSVFPAMRGRQFSIASGGALKLQGQRGPHKPSSVDSQSGSQEHQTRIELLVAIVKYRTVIRRIRRGVCTRYIASLRPGQEISVTIHRGGLKPSRGDINRPVLMIGPGTGVAPLRALTYERKEWRNEETEETRNPLRTIKDLLFFGGRNRSSDYFFADEWDRMSNSLDVYTAFSRDQREKIYVQDVLRERRTEVRRALVDHAGIVYLCG